MRSIFCALAASALLTACSGAPRLAPPVEADAPYPELIPLSTILAPDRAEEEARLAQEIAVLRARAAALRARTAP